MPDELNDSIIKLAGPLLGKSIFSNMRVPPSAARSIPSGHAPASATNPANMLKFMAGKPTLTGGAEPGLQYFSGGGSAVNRAAMANAPVNDGVLEGLQALISKPTSQVAKSPAPAPTPVPGKTRAPWLTTGKLLGGGAVAGGTLGAVADYTGNPTIGDVADTVRRKATVPPVDTGMSKVVGNSVAGASQAAAGGGLSNNLSDYKPGEESGRSWYDYLTNNSLTNSKVLQDWKQHIMAHPWEYGLGAAGAGALGALMMPSAQDEEEEPDLQFKYSQLKLGAGPMIGLKPPALPSGAAPAPAAPVAPKAPSPATQAAPAYQKNMSQIRNSSVIKAPAPSSVRALQQSPTGAFHGALNLTGNMFDNGLLGGLHTGFHGGMYAAGKPVEWAMRGIYGDNAPVSQGWRVWNSQMAQNAKAGLQDMGRTFSVNSGPTARQLHSNQQTGAAAPLPVPKASVTDPMATATKVAPATFGSLSKGLAYTADAMGHQQVADSLFEHGQQVQKSDPNALHSTAGTLSVGLPIGAPIAAAGKAMVGTGRTLAGAKAAPGVFRMIPGARGLGNMATRAGTQAQRVARLDPTPLMLATAPAGAVGGRIGKAVGGNVGQAVGNRVGQIAGLQGVAAAGERLPSGEFKQMPQTSAGLDQLQNDVQHISPDLNNPVYGSLVGASSSPSGAAARAKFIPQQSAQEPTPGFDSATGKWDTQALHSMTPEQRQFMQAQTEQLEQVLPTLPEDQQLAVGQKLLTNKVAMWAQKNNSDPAALMSKVNGDGFQLTDLQDVTKHMQVQAEQQGVQIPSMQDAFNWFQSPDTPGWQKAAMLIGVPLALMGMMSAATGDGPEGLLMAMLGLGGMAVGAGAFGGNSLFKAPPQAPEAPVPAIDPKLLAQAKTDLTAAMADNSLSPQEYDKLNTPAGVQALAGLDDAQLGSMVPMLKGVPPIQKHLQGQLKKYDAAGYIPFSNRDGLAVQSLQKQFPGLSQQDATRLFQAVLTNRDKL